jgi:starch synthase
MRVLFATAELRPLVSAGGLGEAASGLAAGLADLGLDVVTALPDYAGYELSDETLVELDVPDWASPASARIGTHPEAGHLALITVPGIARPNPYVDAEGKGWADNADRFGAFSAAVASVSRVLKADIVHINDWHTALTPAFLAEDVPTVLTIHNLGHQGWAPPPWVHRLPRLRQEYTVRDSVNGLAGAIRVVDRVVAVSPTYANEILNPGEGMGLEADLRARGSDLRGILNGIDARAWNPAADIYTPHFDIENIDRKLDARNALLSHTGWTDNGDPLIVMVTRLVDQKGVDLAFEAARFLEGMKARMIVLGSGEQRLADWGTWLADTQPDRFWFHNGYDAPLSHLLFAGGDILAMPSRFEPCGLAQMQAMAYGTVPVVTPVGGLVDTVIDADLHSDGNGFVASAMDESGFVDAIHRSLRGVRHHGRKRALQRRGMTRDWSWTEPAKEFRDLYLEISST